MERWELHSTGPGGKFKNVRSHKSWSRSLLSHVDTPFCESVVSTHKL